MLNESPRALFSIGENCKNVARAHHASVIIDGEQYFADLTKALESAKSQIVFVGWDFDTRVSLKGGTGGPTIRRFIVSLLKRNQDLRIYIIKWNFGAIKVLFRGKMIFTIIRWMISDRLKIKFDSCHPVGASHHQKLVVVDGNLAFCGGIDATSGRWDTREHIDDDPRRLTPDEEPAEPWHDLSMVFDGAAAEEVHKIASDRWELATGKPLPKVRADSTWPYKAPPTFKNVDIALARTRGEYRHTPSVRENEALFLDMIANAKRFLYAENQYFASRTIAAAISRRLEEEDPPEFVIVMPEKADGWLEQVAMDTARSQLVAMIGTLDHKRRFRIYHPFTKGGTAIYVHAKLTIVDDQIVRIGSSNMNNRSLGFDSECDVAIDGSTPEDGAIRDAIKSIRLSLLAEHLDCSPSDLAHLAEGGSMIAAIEKLRGQGRSLRPFEQEESAELAEYIASNNILDPIGEDELGCESRTRPGRLRERFKKNVSI
jgi:phosphatidylserine/phosphatidylglycerophosphate/cardiolipin synthase-like enzyme